MDDIGEKVPQEPNTGAVSEDDNGSEKESSKENDMDEIEPNTGAVFKDDRSEKGSSKENDMDEIDPNTGAVSEDDGSGKKSSKENDIDEIESNTGAVSEDDDGSGEKSSKENDMDVTEQKAFRTGAVSEDDGSEKEIGKENDTDETKTHEATSGEVLEDGEGSEKESRKENDTDETEPQEHQTRAGSKDGNGLGKESSKEKNNMDDAEPHDPKSGAAIDGIELDEISKEETDSDETELEEPKAIAVSEDSDESEESSEGEIDTDVTVVEDSEESSMEENDMDQTVVEGSEESHKRENGTDETESQEPKTVAVSESGGGSESSKEDNDIDWAEPEEPNIGASVSENCDGSEDSSEEEIDDTEPSEDIIIRDVNMKNIYVTKVQMSNTTKKGEKKRSCRIYNSRNCCPFCMKLMSNFAQHIFGQCHKDEPDVRKMTKKPLKERQRLIRLLRNKGNNLHNNKVLKEKKGQMLLARRSSNTEDASFNCLDYGPCPICLEWLRTSVIVRHNKSCPGKNHDASKSAQCTKGALLLQSNIMSGRLSGNPSQGLLKEVYPIMQIDKVGRLAQEDPLIITIGNQWMKKSVGNKLMRKYYTSGAMRLASRLLIQLRALVKPSSGTFLDDYLCPQYFDDIVDAAHLLCTPVDDDEENLQAPSNGLKLTVLLKKMCLMKRASAIKDGDKQRRSDAKQFLELMELEWNTKLERLLLQERKFRKHDPLPLPTDIEKLSMYMKEAAETADLQDTSYSNFRRNVIISLGLSIGYNRRRPGDVQALT